MVLPWQLGAAPSWPSSLSAVLSSQLTSITSDCSLRVIRLPRGHVLSRSSPHLQRLAHSYSRKCSLSGQQEDGISAQIASGARTQPEQVPTREAHFPGGAALSSQFCAPPVVWLGMWLQTRNLHLQKRRAAFPLAGGPSAED